MPYQLGLAIPDLHVRASSYNGLADGATISTPWTDDSGNGHVVTPTGSPTFEIAFFPGGWPAVQLSGGAYFSVPDAADLELDGDVTIFAVLFVDNSLGGFTKYIVAKMQTTNTAGAFSWYYTSDETIAVDRPFIEVGPRSTSQAPWPLVDVQISGTDADIVGTDGTGSTTFTKSALNAGIATSTPLRIGANANGNLTLLGAIGDLVVFNRALTATEREAWRDALYEKYFGSGEDVILEPNTPPPAPGVTSPAEAESVGPDHLVTWTQDADADGDALTHAGRYRLEGAAEWTSWFSGQDPATLERALPGLADGDYELQIGANDGAVTTWSVTRGFAVGDGINDPPTAPTIRDPVADQVVRGVVGITLGAATDPDGDPLRYELRRRPSGGGVETVVIALQESRIPDWDTAGTPNGGWELVAYAHDGTQYGPGSAPVAVTVDNAVAPAAPVLSVVADGTAAVLSTSDFSDANAEDEHTATQWQVSELADFSTLLHDETTARDPEIADEALQLEHLTAHTVDALPEALALHARARHRDRYGLWSAWSAAESFATTLAAPVITAPAALQVVDASADVTWTEVTDPGGGAVTYDGEVNLGAGWVPLFGDLAALTYAWDTSALAGTLEARVRVRARTAALTGPWGYSGVFVIDHSGALRAQPGTVADLADFSVLWDTTRTKWFITSHPALAGKVLGMNRSGATSGLSFLALRPAGRVTQVEAVAKVMICPSEGGLPWERYRDAEGAQAGVGVLGAGTDVVGPILGIAAYIETKTIWPYGSCDEMGRGGGELVVSVQRSPDDDLTFRYALPRLHVFVSGSNPRLPTCVKQPWYYPHLLVETDAASGGVRIRARVSGYDLVVPAGWMIDEVVAAPGFECGWVGYVQGQLAPFAAIGPTGARAFDGLVCDVIEAGTCGDCPDFPYVPLQISTAPASVAVADDLVAGGGF